MDMSHPYVTHTDEDCGAARAPWHLLSEFQLGMLTVRWLCLALDYDMSFHGPQAWAGRRALHCCSPGSSQTPTPSASTGGCQLPGQLCSVLLSSRISGLSLRQSGVHRVFSQQIPRVKSPCASPMDWLLQAVERSSDGLC